MLQSHKELRVASAEYPQHEEGQAQDEGQDDAYQPRRWLPPARRSQRERDRHREPQDGSTRWESAGVRTSQ